jgi:hypothetical protein
LPPCSLCLRSPRRRIVPRRREELLGLRQLVLRKSQLRLDPPDLLLTFLPRLGFSQGNDHLGLKQFLVHALHRVLHALIF